MKKSNILPVVIFAVVIIIFGAGYIAYKNIYTRPSSPQVNIDTASWETYTDKTYSYSIKYPKGWFITSSENGIVNIANFTEGQLSNQGRKDVLSGADTSKIAITIGLYKETILSGISLIEWLKNNNHYDSDMYGPPVSIKQTTIAGNPGLILSYNGSGPLYVFSAGSHVYYAFYSPEGSKLTGVFDQILSTFKFTNSKPVSQDPKLISFVRPRLSLSQKALIEVTIDEGNYAYGNAGEPDGAGFYWAAAQTNGAWSYIMSGNGIPDCKEVAIFPLGTFGGKFDKCVQGTILFNRSTGKLIQ